MSRFARLIDAIALANLPGMSVTKKKRFKTLTVGGAFYLLWKYTEDDDDERVTSGGRYAWLLMAGLV
jgi:hypothetical protein